MTYGWRCTTIPYTAPCGATCASIPPAYGPELEPRRRQLVLVDEYEGSVNSSEAAAKTVAALGDADLALLAGHGVFVLGSTVRAVHQRAVALEQRCRNGWYVRAAGGVLDSPLPAWFSEQFRRSDGDGFRGFWEPWSARSCAPTRRCSTPRNPDVSASVVDSAWCRGHCPGCSKSKNSEVILIQPHRNRTAASPPVTNNASDGQVSRLDRRDHRFDCPTRRFGITATATARAPSHRLETLHFPACRVARQRRRRVNGPNR